MSPTSASSSVPPTTPPTDGVWGPTAEATPDNPDLVFGRVRRLVRMRTKLSTADEAFVDQWQEWARREAVSRFGLVTAASRGEVQALMAACDLGDGYRQLQVVHPMLGNPESPSEARAAIMALDGLDGVAFDLSRRVASVLAYVDELRPVWRGLWADLAVATSVDQAEAQFAVVCRAELEQAASLRAFLQFYNMTAGRVARCYEKLSRMITVDQGLQGPAIPRFPG